MTTCAPSQVASIVQAIDIMVKEGAVDATQVSEVTAHIVLVAEQLKTHPADLPAVIEAVLSALVAQGIVQTLPTPGAVATEGVTAGPQTGFVWMAFKKCCGMA
jgi:hypothetical protein